MENDLDPEANGTVEKPETRPVLLTVLCLAAFMFFAILSVLFFTGIIYSEWITGVTDQYIPENKYSTSQFRVLFVSGFLLHALAFVGVILIWRLIKTGYYLLGISSLVIASYQLFQPGFTVASTSVYIFLLICFGMFYKWFH
ncbi:MAG: hypothetical protein WCP32_12790 [Bacteroidota bacterium]